MIKDLEIPKLLILLILLITAIILFLIYGIPTDANEFLIIYILKTRYQKLIALILVGICIGSSSLIFQTLTNNRLLTPSIIGLDSLCSYPNRINVFNRSSACHKIFIF